MKAMFLITVMIIGSNSFGRSNIFTKEPSRSPDVTKTVREKTDSIEGALPKGKPKSSDTEVGNLPAQYGNRLQNGGFDSNPVITPTTKRFVQNAKFKLAEVIRAEIKESLIAFPDSKTPIRALVKSGPLKGTLFLGEATLEKNSKRILISFKKLREPEMETAWNVQASALDSRGILGIEGTLESGQAKYFAGELLSAGAAGYADASIQRSQTVIGNQVEEPTADTLTKKALVSALSKSAERFGDQVKNAPEYVHIEGPFEIQILIVEQPRLEE